MTGREPGSPGGGARAVETAAQAKVNLRLRILAREASGYHQLETLLLRLTLADVVRVRRSTQRTLDVSGVSDATAIGPMEKNLAWRAAVAYREAAGNEGFAIELEKQIPIGGGLGGGSADAGAVLRALDAMARKPLGEPALLRIASTLGADVPFLTTEHPYALAWGRGERLLPLPPPPLRLVLLMFSSLGVNTGEAYGWLAAARARAGAAPATAAVLHPDRLSEWEQIVEVATNDFEPVVGERHPAIKMMLEMLRDSGDFSPVLLAGSGSAVFGVAPDGVTPWGAVTEIEGETHEAQAEGSLRPLRVTTTATAQRVEPVVVLD